MDDPTIDVVLPDSPDARAALRAYVTDVASSFLGRPATAEEVDDSLRDDPSDHLAPPGGLLLLARLGGAVGGCAGLHLLGDDGGPGVGIGEVKRVFVEPTARGHGIGRQLMAELERLARGLGGTQLRLDTRHDLVEARAIYSALGYEEVPAFNNGRYAEHWLAKSLG